MSIAERHALSFADVEVEIVLDTEGDISVQFTSPDGESQVSFDWENWQRVIEFAEASLKVTS